MNLNFDPKVARASVQKDGRSLEGLNFIFKDNESIVMDAVGQNGLALQYASERLKADDRIVRRAIRSNVDAIAYARGLRWSFRRLLLRLFYEREAKE